MIIIMQIITNTTITIMVTLDCTLPLLVIIMVMIIQEMISSVD